MMSMLVVLASPLVVFWLFSTRPPAVAVTATVLGAYLLLPRNYSIEMPAVPSLDKDSIPALTAVLAAAIMIRGPRLRALPAGHVQPGWIPRSRVVRLLLVVMLAGSVATVLTNTDRLIYGDRVLPPLRFYDAASFFGNTLFSLLAFLLARKYLAHPDNQKVLLIGLAVAGLAYTLPALYEIRFSPQLSRMFYGYFPHQWQQHLRAGGYRPVVFLAHGLWLAIFFCGAFLAALTLWRSSAGPARTRWLLAAGWLFMTLVLAKGIGALAIGAMLGAMIVLLPVRLQILGAAILAGVILVYPMLRGAGLVPTEAILNLAGNFDTDRRASLQFRFDNEDLLLARANERPLFGWGGYGRNRVFDEKGVDQSTTDGSWILLIGGRGWIGYLGQFGLLLLPVLLFGLRWKQLALTPATAGLAMALIANMIDLIPNATLTSVTLLMGGALAGRLELGRIADTAGASVPGEPAIRPNAYTRQTRRHPPRGVPAA